MTAQQAKPLPKNTFVDPNAPHQPPPQDCLSSAALQDINRQSAQSNGAVYPSHHETMRSARDDGSMSTSSRPPAPYNQNDFEIHTISPSPKSERTLTDPSTAHDSPSALSFANSLSSLQVSTDLSFVTPKRNDSVNSRDSSSAPRSGFAQQNTTPSASLAPVTRTPSWKQHFSRGIGSAASSVYNSPVITAMGDVTPLPSPLLSSDSPGPWRRVGARPPSRELALPVMMSDSVLVTKSGESVAAAIENQMKRKAYAGLTPGHAAENGGKGEYAQNRSISEYVPDSKGVLKRQNTVSAGKVDERSKEDSVGLRREPNLSEARGLTSTAKPPTPPPSESSQNNDKKRPHHENFEARGRRDQKLRRWRGIRDLGEGTFSRVILATSQVNAQDVPEQTDAEPTPESRLDRKTLVAIKICEHGPKGGASEDRIEMSLKRELDIMQSIDHPSLVRLKAWSIEPTRALLVLNYCPGGDLFDVASSYRDSLTSPLLQRIFAELVGAVRYLHERRIVHRDIKLENVLVNIPPSEFNENQDWATYPYPVVTLTDLGLSRRVADDEKLETRCGSDDYAAPEVILGQPYDGRATDAWSLGVLLYALIESRLPFDPPPGANDYQRMRSRTSHRIARVEWNWIKYAGNDGDHDANIALFEKDGLKGAMEITEGLLRRYRNRWAMDQVVGHEWIQNAIQVEGGLRFREEDDGQEVS